jgi:hypothetical protein
LFNDLDATLRVLLGDPTAPADLRAADISFETPDKDFTPARATVNLFLYEVQENRSLRESAPVLERADSRYVSSQPPVRMDCAYLVTAWSTKAGSLKAEEEHRILGLALLWLNKFPVIQNGFLQGSLANPPQPYPLLTLVAQFKEDQSNGQFWTALGISPRPAFSLTVTIAMPSLDELDQFPEVRAVRLEAASLAEPALTGRVLDNALAPVVGARVTVVETAETRTVGVDAVFRFDRLAFGKYTLLVQVVDRPEVREEITYAADRQVHNVILPDP